MAGDLAVRNRTFEQPEHAMARSNICTFDGGSQQKMLLRIKRICERVLQN